MDLSSYVLMQTEYFDIRFGPIDIYYNPEDTTDIIFCKSKASASLQEHQQSIKTARERLSNNFPYIMPMIHFEADDANFVIKVFFEYPNEDLFARKEALAEPSEMIHFFHDLLHAVGYLEKKFMVHGNLRPEYIYYNQKNNRYILLDRLVDVSSPNQTQLNNIEQNLPLYMSPVVFNEIVRQNMNFKHNPFKAESFALGMVFLSVTYSEEEIQLLYDVDHKSFDMAKFGLLIQDIRHSCYSEGVRQSIGDFLFECLLNADTRLCQRPLKALKTLKGLFLNSRKGTEDNPGSRYGFVTQSLDTLRQSGVNSDEISLSGSMVKEGTSHQAPEANLLASMKDAYHGARFLSFCNFPGGASLLEALQAEMQKNEPSAQTNFPGSMADFQYLSERVTQDYTAHNKESEKPTASKPFPSRESFGNDEHSNIFKKPLPSEKQLTKVEETAAQHLLTANFFGLENAQAQLETLRESFRQHQGSFKLTDSAGNFFKPDDPLHKEYQQQFQDYLAKFAVAPDDNNYSLFNLASSRKFISEDGTWRQLNQADAPYPPPDDLNPLDLLPTAETPLYDRRGFSFNKKNYALENQLGQPQPSIRETQEQYTDQHDDPNQADETQEQNFRESLRSQTSKDKSPQPAPSDAELYKGLTEVSPLSVTPSEVNALNDGLLRLPTKDASYDSRENCSEGNLRYLVQDNSLVQKASPRSSLVSNAINLSYANDENYLKLKRYLENEQEEDIDFLQSVRQVNKNFSFQQPQGTDLLQQLLQEERSNAQALNPRDISSGFKKAKFQNLMEVDYSSYQQSNDGSPKGSGSKILKHIDESKPAHKYSGEESESGYKPQRAPDVPEPQEHNTAGQEVDGEVKREERKTIKSRFNYNSSKNIEEFEKSSQDIRSMDSKNQQPDSRGDSGSARHLSERNLVSSDRNFQKAHENSQRSLKGDGNHLTATYGSQPQTSISPQAPLSRPSLGNEQKQSANHKATGQQANFEYGVQSEINESRLSRASKRSSGYFNIQSELARLKQDFSQQTSRKSIKIQTSERELPKTSLVSDKQIQTDEAWQKLSNVQATSVSLGSQKDIAYHSSQVEVLPNPAHPSGKDAHLKAPSAFAQGRDSDKKPNRPSGHVPSPDATAISNYPMADFKSQASTTKPQSEKTPAPQSHNEFLTLIANSAPVEMLDAPKFEHKRIIVNKGDFEKKPRLQQHEIEVIEEDEEGENDYSIPNSKRQISHKKVALPVIEGSPHESKDVGIKEIQKSPSTNSIPAQLSNKSIEVQLPPSPPSRAPGDQKKDLQAPVIERKVSAKAPLPGKESGSMEAYEFSSHDATGLHSLLSNIHAESTSKPISENSPPTSLTELKAKTSIDAGPKTASPSQGPPPLPVVNSTPALTSKDKGLPQLPQPAIQTPPVIISSNPQLPRPNYTDERKPQLIMPKRYSDDVRANMTPELRPKEGSFTQILVKPRQSSPELKVAPKLSGNDICVQERPKVIVRSLTPSLIPKAQESKLVVAKVPSNEAHDGLQSTTSSSQKLPMRSVEWVNSVESSSAKQFPSDKLISGAKVSPPYLITGKPQPNDQLLPIKTSKPPLPKNYPPQLSLNPSKPIHVSSMPFQPPLAHGAFNQPQVVHHQVQLPPLPHMQRTIVRVSRSPVRVVEKQNFSDKFIHKNPPILVSHSSSFHNIYSSPISSPNSSRENSFKVSGVKQPSPNTPGSIGQSNVPLDFFRKLDKGPTGDLDNYDIISTDKEMSVQGLSKKSLQLNSPNLPLRESEKLEANKFVSEKELVFVRKDHGVDVYRYK